jgi:hypothetical protein
VEAGGGGAPSSTRSDKEIKEERRRCDRDAYARFRRIVQTHLGFSGAFEAQLTRVSRFDFQNSCSRDNRPSTEIEANPTARDGHMR